MDHHGGSYRGEIPDATAGGRRRLICTETVENRHSAGTYVDDSLGSWAWTQVTCSFVDPLKEGQ